MGGFKILLVTVLFFGAFYPASIHCNVYRRSVPAVTSIQDALELLSLRSDEEQRHASGQSSSTLLRHARSTETEMAVRMIEELPSRLMHLPMEIFAMISRAMQSLLSAVSSRLETLHLYVAQMFKNVQVALLEQSNERNGPNERNRRSLSNVEGLLMSVPEMLAHPIEFAEQSVNGAQDYVRNQTVTALESGLRSSLHFMSTSALPWLHDTLINMEKSQNLPQSIRMLINNFNTFYSILQLFGYVN